MNESEMAAERILQRMKEVERSRFGSWDFDSDEWRLVAVLLALREFNKEE